MKDEEIPCYSCDNAVFGFNEYEPHGGFIRCACPMKDKRGRCNCEDARQLIVKTGGSL